MQSGERSRRWRALPRERRRRIARAVLRGQAVTDQRDAALAVAFAATRLERVERFERTWFWRWLGVRHAIVLAALGVLIGIALHDRLLIAMAGLPAIYVVAAHAFLARLRTRLAVAQAQNERLV